MRQSVRQQPTVTDQLTDNSESLVTVAEAVELLGLSEDAIRARLRRGTLSRVDMPDGRVLVDLSSADGQPTASKTTTTQLTDNSESLVEALNAHISTLHDQLEVLNSRLDREQQANAENRRIIAGLTNRLPELSSPEATGASQTSSEHQGNGTGRTDNESPGKPPWWRRFLGL